MEEFKGNRILVLGEVGQLCEKLAAAATSSFAFKVVRAQDAQQALEEIDRGKVRYVLVGEGATHEAAEVAQKAREVMRWDSEIVVVVSMQKSAEGLAEGVFNGRYAAGRAEGNATEFVKYLRLLGAIVKIDREEGVEVAQRGVVGESMLEVAQGLGKVRVLVADDEPLVRESVRASLEIVGFEVEEAADGREAVEKFRAAHDAGRTPDVVFTDFRMPHLNGYEVATQVREIDAQVPVVLQSGFEVEEAREMNAKECVLSCVLAKPFRFDEAESLIRGALVRRVLDESRAALSDGKKLNGSAPALAVGAIKKVNGAQNVI